MIKIQVVPIDEITYDIYHCPNGQMIYVGQIEADAHYFKILDSMPGWEQHIERIGQNILWDLMYKLCFQIKYGRDPKISKTGIF